VVKKSEFIGIHKLEFMEQKKRNNAEFQRNRNKTKIILKLQTSAFQIFKITNNEITSASRQSKHIIRNKTKQ